MIDQNQQMRLSRRDVLDRGGRAAAGLAGTAWLAEHASAQSRPAGANERVRVAFVGTPRRNNYLPETLSRRHIRNFLDCVRSRKQPNVDVETGQRATTVPHLGNIAYRTGRKIRWDAEKEQIIDDPEASNLLTRTYRAPYVLPEV